MKTFAPKFTENRKVGKRIASAFHTLKGAIVIDGLLWVYSVFTQNHISWNIFLATIMKVTLPSQVKKNIY